MGKKRKRRAKATSIHSTDPFELTVSPFPCQTHAVQLRTAQQGVDLAAWLSAPHRKNPVLVATTSGGDIVLPLDEWAADFDGRAEIIDVRGEALTQLFERLPSDVRCAGDAARGYPRLSATPNASVKASRPWPCRTPEEVVHVTRIARTFLTQEASRLTAGTARRLRDSWQPGAVSTVTTYGEGLVLAEYLRRGGRPPVVAISEHPDRGFLLDPEQLASQANDTHFLTIRVAEMASYALTDEFGNSGRVFHGAVRVYPTDTAWLGNEHLAPLILAERVNPAATIRWALDTVSARPARMLPPPRPDSEPVVVVTKAQAVDLAETLLDPSRSWPVVVITIDPSNNQRPYLDPRWVSDQTGPVATIAVVSAEATYSLTDRLGKEFSCFFGAARTYPPNPEEWLADRELAPLRLCSSPRQGRAVARQVVDDVYRAATESGVFTRDTQAAVRIQATVTSVNLSEHHLLVELPDRQPAIAVSDRIHPGTHPHRLAKVGQPLTGVLQRQPHTEFLPDPPEEHDTLLRAQTQHSDQSHALVLVAHVEADRAVGLLHPDVPLQITDPTEPDLQLLLTENTVVAITVNWHDQEASGILYDPEAVDTLTPGMPILPGGPAWLQPEDLTTIDAADDGPTPEPTTPQYSFEPAADETESDAVIEQLEAALQASTSEAARLETKVHEQAQQIERLQQALRAKPKPGQRPDRKLTALFDDPTEQFRHEVHHAWLVRIQNSQRDHYPLSDYIVGPNFLHSVTALPPSVQDKVPTVVAEVASGLAKELPARAVRIWTDGKGGQPLRRRDGATALRVDVANNTPGAPRMKVWKQKDGLLEIDTVGHHDRGLAQR